MSLETVKDRIARLTLGDVDNEPPTIGRIHLRPHQQSAVLQLRDSIREFGGAILCDPVGTGKTFISLSLPRVDSKLTIVAPAVLRDMWNQALAITNRAAQFVSFESLSRGKLAPDRSDFVIVDEAHHARNAHTSRFRLLAQFVSRTDVVLLTATPIHNRRSDLVTLLSLFLGERASLLTSAELSKCLIRRDDLQASIEGMPAVDVMSWSRIREDDRIPELLLSLPPPLPPKDGGDGGVLIARSLIRQWASSDAALAGGIRRRVVRAESLIAALSDGTWPSKQELLSWIAGEEGVQLGLPGILASGSSNTSEMLAVVRKHLDGLRHILDVLRHSAADVERASLVRTIRRIHRDRGIVAFSQYADTVDGVFRGLSGDGKVAALTGSGARVAGGRISRSDAIARFAPVASGQRPPRESEAVTLLLTTDLLSEGVNLQDAGVVIHLDLPWTPARMEQRLGRIARVGSLHKRVQSYAILPPLSADSVIRIEQILRNKIQAAGVVVPAFPLLFGWSEAAHREKTAFARNEAIRSLLSPWLSATGGLDRSAHIAATALSRSEGFVAVVTVADRIRIVVRSGNAISESPEEVLDVLRECVGAEAETRLAELAACENDVLSWVEADLALRPSDRSSLFGTSVRGTAAKRINRALRKARTHERSRLAIKAEKALDALSGNLGAYDESELCRICSNVPDGDELLDQIIDLLGVSSAKSLATPQVIAMILLRKMNALSPARKC